MSTKRSLAENAFPASLPEVSTPTFNNGVVYLQRQRRPGQGSRLTFPVSPYFLIIHSREFIQELGPLLTKPVCGESKNNSRHYRKYTSSEALHIGVFSQALQPTRLVVWLT